MLSVTATSRAAYHGGEDRHLAYEYDDEPRKEPAPAVDQISTTSSPRREVPVATLNGWSEAREAQVVRIVVGGDKNGATVLAGDVATAFRWLLEQFHARVEPIKEVNGWRSAAFNRQVGGAARSNHISGTAVDVNGARHPYERHQPGRVYSSGFTNTQAAAVRAILKEAGGLFTWGLDFRVGLRDAMHFELANRTTKADVAAFVAKIRAGQAATLAAAATEEEDDMPTAEEIARAVWSYRNAELERKDTYAILRRTSANAEAAAHARVDARRIADAIASAMPEGTLTRSDVRRAARRALEDVLAARDAEGAPAPEPQPKAKTGTTTKAKQATPKSPAKAKAPTP